MLTIIVPVKNESENLKPLFDYYSRNLTDISFEVLIINDFSDDDTFINGKNLTSKVKNFKILNNDAKGLGGAIRLGIKNAEGKYISIMMADLSDDIEDLKKYHNLISSEQFDAIFGSRFLKLSLSQSKRAPALFTRSKLNTSAACCRVKRSSMPSGTDQPNRVM